MRLFAVALPALLALSPSLVAAGITSPPVGPLKPPPPKPDDTAARLKVSESLARFPLSFERNQGQVAKEVRYLARGSGYQLYLTPTEATFVFLKQAPPPEGKGRNRFRTPPETERKVVRMGLMGANPAPKVEGLEELPGKVNYFLGDDPKEWRRNIPTFGKVRFREVYRGVDLVYYGNQKQLEYDFVVKPGADPSAIRIAFQGTNRIETDLAGNLLLTTSWGQLSFKKPVVYQEIAGQRVELASKFVVKSMAVGFEVATYDARKPLVIDPTLSYSTFLGGGGSEFINGVAVDPSGSAYVTGETNSVDFPVVNAFDSELFALTRDVFVSKIASDGRSLVYSTFMGGNRTDIGNDIAVDSSGYAYVCGAEASGQFPKKGPYDQGETTALVNCFVAKFDPLGNLIYSTLFGTKGDEGATALALHGTEVLVTGFVYVQGNQPFPLLQAYQTTPGDMWIAKLKADGAFAFSTFFGPQSPVEFEYDTFPVSIGVGPGGAPVVLGRTVRSDLPVENALQPSLSGASDMFLTALPAAGRPLLFSTYLGGGNDEVPIDVAVDNLGSIYTYGYTTSADYPTVNPIQTTIASGYVLTKISASGNQILYSGAIGAERASIPVPGGEFGGVSREGGSMAVDIDGGVFLTGSNSTPALPVKQGIFVVRLTPAADAFVWQYNVLKPVPFTGSKFADGSPTGIGLDAANNCYVGGSTGDPQFPILNAFQPVLGGTAPGFSGDAFVFKLLPTIPPGITSVDPTTGPSLGGTSFTIAGSLFQPGLTVSFGGALATVTNVTGNAITGSTPAHVAGPVDVVVTNPDGAESALENGFTYEVCATTLPSATVSGSASICPGSPATLSVALTGSGPWNLVWSDGFTQAGVGTSPAERVVAPSATTTYTVTSVTDQNCTAAGSGSAVVTASPAPSAAISAVSALCIGSNSQASVPDAGTGATYAWTIANGTILSGASSRTVQFKADQQLGPLTLSVSVTSAAAGCTSTGSQQVLIGNPPTATLLETSSLTLTVNLTGIPPWRVTWTDGFVQSGITTSPVTRSVEPFLTTTYTLSAVGDATGCPGTVSGSATVVVAPILMVPGAVSMPVGYDRTVLLFLATPVSATTTLTLGNSDPTVVSGPSTITIPAGQRTASFTLRGLKAGGPVGLSVTLPGVGTATCTATVTVPIVILTQSDLSIPLGGRFALPAFLSAFPASDTTLEITSSNTSILQIEGPSSKTIKVGNNHDTFLLHAVGVGGPVVVTISSPQLGPGASATVLVSVPSASQPCSGSATALCLGASRFSVQVAWQSYFDGSSGVGTAVPLTGDSGYFWFFNDQNVELIVKVLDGRAVNNSFWVLYGALSDVSYTITVTDTVTGQSKTYYNPAHTLASVADVTAFPGTGRPAVRVGGELGRLASLAPRDVGRSAPAARATASPSSSRSPLATCTSGPNDLCLNAARFSVSVSWRNYNNDETGAGQAVALTGDSGYFWFFSSENVELVVKVLDGTATNGKFWVLYGALSDVEYTITITDTSTGTTKTYFNPAHTLASRADITAF